MDQFKSVDSLVAYEYFVNSDASVINPVLDAYLSAACRQFGLARESLLFALNLTESNLQDPEHYQSMFYGYYLQELVLASGIPPVRFISVMTEAPHKQTVLAHLIASSSSLSDAIVWYERFRRVSMNFADVDIEHAGSSLILRSRYVCPHFLAAGWELAFYARALSFVRSLFGSHVSSVALHTTLAEPGESKTLQRVFGPTIEYQAKESALIVALEELNPVNPSSDPLLLRVFSERMLATQDSRMNRMHFVCELRKHMLTQIKSGARPSQAGCALMMNMSERTLRNRLGEFNVQFSDIRQQMDIEIANIYLRDTEYSIAEISDALSFSDAASFIYSFKSTRGLTPANFRQQSRAHVQQVLSSVALGHDAP